MFFFFFFQAEDGIRDGTVTGVQTCALPILRLACSGWTELEAPYDCAKVRVLMARAYRQLGDLESSERELDEACSAFEELGAELDAKEAARERRAPVPSGRTKREGAPSSRRS